MTASPTTPAASISRTVAGAVAAQLERDGLARSRPLRACLHVYRAAEDFPVALQRTVDYLTARREARDRR